MLYFYILFVNKPHFENITCSNEIYFFIFNSQVLLLAFAFYFSMLLHLLGSMLKNYYNKITNLGDKVAS